MAIVTLELKPNWCRICLLWWVTVMTREHVDKTLLVAQPLLFSVQYYMTVNYNSVWLCQRIYYF